MIKYSFHSRSIFWPARIKKVNILVKNVLKFEKELNFKKNFEYNFNFILTDNKLIKKMNLKYRKKNKATDVLTFISDIKINNKINKVCDIFFSAEIIKMDSKKNNVNFYDHLAHLIIHSFLHINGFIHKTIKDFNKMKKIEIKILKKIGIQNPYYY